MSPFDFSYVMLGRFCANLYVLTLLRTCVPTFFQIYELKNKMRSSGMPWPGDEGWNLAWRSIKKVLKFKSAHFSYHNLDDMYQS